jgi:Zn-dependent peptidase ImmA (M78 family)
VEKKPSLTKIYSMLDSGLSYVDIARHYNCNKGTIFNMVKRDKERRFNAPLKMAKKVLVRYEVVTPPINVTTIIKAEGFKILKQKLPSDISGMIEKTKTEKNIYINSNHAPTRQRFTLAHELGHHFLHTIDGEHKDNATLFRKDTDTLSIDQEANRFAAELLMPDKLLRKEIALSERPLDHDLVDMLANTFEVSVIALTYRLQNLGFHLL